MTQTAIMSVGTVSNTTKDGVPVEDTGVTRSLSRSQDDVEDEFDCLSPDQANYKEHVQWTQNVIDSLHHSSSDSEEAPFNKLWLEVMVRSSDPWENRPGPGNIRCICGSTGEDDPEQEDEFMVQCGMCHVWQHGFCMGYEEDCLEETYQCEQCMPDLHEERLVEQIFDLSDLRNIDKVEYQALLEGFISRKSRVDRILSLDNDVICMFLDVLQRTIDESPWTPIGTETNTHRNKCGAVLRRISRKSHVLPSILFVPGIRRIGEHPVAGGAGSDIWKGMLNGRKVALKVLRDFQIQDTQKKADLHKRFDREALIWRQLRHEHIYPFIGLCNYLFGPSPCMVSPWSERGDIISYLKSPEGQKCDRTQTLASIADALCFLHAQDPPLVHGDLKGANILVNERGQPCIADFGISNFTESCSLGAATSFAMGTLRWMPPEKFRGTNTRSTAGDVYSFACVCLEVYSLKAPWQEVTNEVGIIAMILSGARPSRPVEASIPDQMWSVIERCWQDNPEDRPSIDLVLRDIYLAQAAER